MPAMSRVFVAARDMALKWMLDYPLNHDRGWNKWAGFFEDIPRQRR